MKSEGLFTEDEGLQSKIGMVNNMKWLLTETDDGHVTAYWPIRVGNLGEMTINYRQTTDGSNVEAGPICKIGPAWKYGVKNVKLTH